MKPACIVLSHNAGLFSLVNKVVMCMSLYERVQVDFTKGDPHPYQPNTENLWDKLFKPTDPIGGPCDQVLYYPSMWLTGPDAAKCYAGDQGWRHDLNFYWNKLEILPAIQERIDRFAKEHIGGRPYVSALIRSDYHSREQANLKSQPLEWYEATIRGELQAGELVYVSAGDHKTIQWFQQRFDNLVVFPDTRRLPDRELDLLIHSPNTAEDAINCLIEVVIMSQGRALIHPVSNMSTAALYMNPKLKGVFLP